MAHIRTRDKSHIKNYSEYFNYDSDLLSESPSEPVSDNELYENFKKSINSQPEIMTIDFDEHEKQYFNNLDDDKQEYILAIKNKLQKSGLNNKPLLFKILESSCDEATKILLLEKINELKKMDTSTSEYYKLHKYIKTILDIPFNIYINEDYEDAKKYIENSYNILNQTIYGHQEVKLHILQIASHFIKNPMGTGNVFGIYGPPGIGKTTIIKDGLSKVLNRPFSFISLGGAADSSFLDGHSYTYEGSQHGKIVEALVKSKCLNPIIYFDELDKISSTPKGDEITNMLIHLTDSSQNTCFQDKYFTGFNIDISKVIFVFSFNNLENIDPILRDRINLISLHGFTRSEKLHIAKEYLLESIYKNFNMKDISFKDEALYYMIDTYSNEDGVRELKRKLQEVISKINLITLVGSSLCNLPRISIKFPLKITTNLLRKILKK